MPRYLGFFRYSPEGAKGFLKQKAVAREAEIRKIYEGIGGKVEAVYWAATGGEQQLSSLRVKQCRDQKDRNRG